MKTDDIPDSEVENINPQELHVAIMAGVIQRGIRWDLLSVECCRIDPGYLE